VASAILGNRIRQNTATTGTGTATLGAAFSNAFLTVAEAGIADGSTVTYCFEEGLDFEIGRGVVGASGTTVTRATVLKSKIGGTAGTSKMNLAGAATMRIVAAKEDLDVNDFDEDTSPDTTADFAWMYDASAALKKKVKPQNMKQAGGMQLLTSGTVSAAATLDIVLTAYTGYRGLKIFLAGVLPATNATDLFMRVSTNGGSTYDATNGYDWGITYIGNGLTDLKTGANEAQWKLAAQSITSFTAMANTAGTGGYFEITLLKQTSTSFHPRIFGVGAYQDSNAIRVGVTFFGQRTVAQDTDAIRFLMSSGNINGDYSVYGLI